MKVFVSWSGKRSRAVAELLNDWVKCVIQATPPWISTRDIDRGALWFTEIGDQLQDTTVGIICLTQENKNKPWILFEAGALAKGLSSSRVCTFLIDLNPADLQDPLAQFNHTRPDREGLYNLVRTLNSTLGPARLPDKTLDQIFGTYWPQFERDFTKALEDHPSDEKPEVRTDESLLAEILENTRSLNSRVGRLEIRKQSPSKETHFYGPPYPLKDTLNPDVTAAVSTTTARLLLAKQWMKGAKLIEDSNGSLELIIKAQDIPSRDLSEVIQMLAEREAGATVRVVYEGIPSQ